MAGMKLICRPPWNKSPCVWTVQLFRTHFETSIFEWNESVILKLFPSINGMWCLEICNMMLKSSRIVLWNTHENAWAISSVYWKMNCNQISITQNGTMHSTFCLAQIKRMYRVKQQSTDQFAYWNSYQYIFHTMYSMLCLVYENIRETNHNTVNWFCSLCDIYIYTYIYISNK